MSRPDTHHHPRPRYWPCPAILLLLPACFHTEYLQDDAGAAAGHDAGMVDPDAASPPPDAFSYADCPSTYDVALPGPTRYRLITSPARAWEHSDTCAGDLRGATHLAVVETAAEVAAIQALIDKKVMVDQVVIANNAVLIGGVQLKTAMELDESWFGFDGQPLINNAWHFSTGDPEPNDLNGKEEGKEQFISIIAGNNGLNDADGKSLDKLKGALCECDGHPIAKNAADAVDSYRMP